MLPPAKLAMVDAVTLIVTVVAWRPGAMHASARTVQGLPSSNSKSISLMGMEDSEMQSQGEGNWEKVDYFFLSRVAYR